MACPFIDGNTRNGFHETEGKLDYTKYLKLDGILESVNPLSNVHDEHLFLVTHQAYELWFKQIIHEIDSIREIFMLPKVNESHMLRINSRLARVSKIVEVLVDQIKVLETMAPMEFMEFRDKLESSSGFQSWQFRMIENKLGVKNNNRINHNQASYFDALTGKYRELVKQSEDEPSLFDLVRTWLERTPVLKDDSFNFIKSLEENCQKWFHDEREAAKNEQNNATMKEMLEAVHKKETEFQKIFDEEKYNEILSKGDMFLSWKALHGALLICFYRDEVGFHQAFQMLQLLMDIDTWIMKWRANHALLVQRMIGSSIGSGGSSGYRYLRATVSDRYKAFQDLFLLSNYLIPRAYLPELHVSARRRLATVCMQ